MYILPNATAFNNACKDASRTVATKCEVWVGGSLSATMLGDGINGEIISMEWDNIVCSNDGLQIGTCCMDEFKMTYRPVSTTISLMGKEIHPYVGLEFGSPATVTYVPLGVFYVTDVSSEDEDRTFNITAYDGMQRLLDNFDATALGITFPINAWTLLNTIATHFGFTVDYRGDFWDLVTADDLNLNSVEPYQLQVGTALESNRRWALTGAYEGTYRDYIGWIVGLVGAYAHMGRNGELVVSRYVDYGFDVDRDVQHMGGSKINYGGSVTYTSIVSGTDENPIYPTNYGGNAITYTNPYMTVDILDNLCDQIIDGSGITVTPCDITWRCNPCVDAGDIVSIEDKDGNMSSTYVMERVVSVTGGLVETLHCYGETEVMHTLNKSPLITKLTQLSQDTKDFAELINGTSGTFQFIDNGDGTNGGFTIYENGSSSWLRCTAGGIGISPDGGLTYTNAITKNGVVATSLKVLADNGNTLLEADDRLNGDEVFFRVGNVNGNLFLRARTYISSGGYYEGQALGDFLIYNPETGKVFMSVSCSPGNSSLTLSDPVSGNGAISIQSYSATNNGNTYTKGSFTIQDPNDMNLPTVVISNVESLGYLGIKDENGSYHYMTPRAVTIGGTTYYILASTS